MYSTLVIMAHIFHGVLFVLLFAHVAIGYYRRQAGYRLVGDHCLQWRYFVKQISSKPERMRAKPEFVDAVTVRSYKNAVVQLVVWVMTYLERNANVGDDPARDNVVGVIILHAVDVFIGLMAKIFLICYAVLRFWCSAELSTFDKARHEKWHNVNYDGLREQASIRYKIVYIRHGESMWNKLFNRGVGLHSLNQIISGLFEEVLMATEMDSQILDSPLSKTGVEQASELGSWVIGSTSQFTEAYTDKCCFLTSNLRRAMGTVLLGFGKRVGEKNSIRVLSCLQELTRNPDSISYAFAENTTPLELFGTAEVPEEVVNMASSKLNWLDNKGNRGLFDKIEDRFAELISYCERVHAEENIKVFIISGHSLFLKKFLQFYLPPTSNEPGVSRKISNCGVLSFDMLTAQIQGARYHCIDSKSVELVKGRYL